MDATQRPEQFGRWSLLGLWLGSFALYVAANGQVALWDRDEPRYAQSTVQMLRRGDFLVPYYLTYDQSGDPDRPDPRFHKPPMIYWVQAAACSVFGVNEFGLRFPSAVFGATSVVLVALIGRALLGARIGLWAAILLAAAPLMQTMCKLCLCDAPLLAFIVAALWLLARQMRHGPSAGAAAAMWACLGLALLTKGPVCLLYYLSPVAFMAIFGGADMRRRVGECLVAVRLPPAAPAPVRWVVHGLAGPLLMLVIVAVWIVPVQIVSWNFVDKDGDPASFWDVSMGTHVINRALHPSENHGGPPGYYVLLVLATFFPWSLLLPFALRAGLRRPDPPKNSDGPGAPAAGDDWVRLFLMGWAVFPWAFLELHATKLPHYFLPALPALALLTARFLFNEGSAAGYWRSGRPKAVLSAISVLLIGACFLGTAAAAAVLSGWNIPGLLPLDPETKIGRQVIEGWQSLEGMSPFLFAGVLLTVAASVAPMLLSSRAYRSDRTERGLALQAAAMAVGGLLLGATVLPNLTPIQISRRAADWIAANVPARGDIVLVGLARDQIRGNYDEPSLVVYLGGRARIADQLEVPTDGDPEKLRSSAMHLLSRPGTTALAADLKYWKELQKAGADLPEPQVVISGFNYVNGRAVRLGIAALRR